MDLSKIAIEPRLRNGWEAIDLGVIMARKWWWPLTLSWLVPSLVVYLILSLVLYRVPWLAVVVTWWLKPLFDRLPLVLASRALFGEALDVRGVLRQCLKIFKTDWFASLTWRRFSPTRSFDMPITVLEGLRGGERSRRMTVLHQTAANSAVWLTFVLVTIESSLILAMWAVLLMMVPEQVAFDWEQALFAEEGVWAFIGNSLSYFAMVLVAPFYTIAGFAIYISRRIELEGWDIEIRFRHLAERLSKRTRNRRSSKVAVCLLPFFMSSMFLMTSVDSRAQSDAVSQDQPQFVQEYYADLNDSAEASSAKQTITEILSGEDFNLIEETEGWRLKNIEEEQANEEIPDWIIAFFEFFEWFAEATEPLRDFLGLAASGIEMLIWGVVILVVGYLIYRYRDALASLVGVASVREGVEQEAPTVMFGLDVRKENLPDDVPAQVMAMWRQGKNREAIGLLYSATLSSLIHQFAFEFFDGYTELECARVVKSGNNPQLSEYVSHLTSVWQRIAYAHRMPVTEQVDDLCKQWPRFFATSSGESQVAV